MNGRTIFHLSVFLTLVASGITTGLLAQTPDPTSSPLDSAIVSIPATTPPRGFVYVTTVIDGDTIEVVDPSDPSRRVERVRYIGIDTPETVHPKKKVECYGPEASAYNRSLVEHQFVRLVRDLSDTDMYGRLLRYIYREDGTLVNHALVMGGYAVAKPYPPDLMHAHTLQEAQKQAKTNRNGLWGACPIGA